MKQHFTPRRHFIQRVSFGLFGISTVGYTAGQGIAGKSDTPTDNPRFNRYPAIHDDLSFGVVSASHNDLQKVKDLVKSRPELASASWDWGFGDYETALGAASHMGRRDIAEFLMSEGARPDIFTFAMMGMLKSLQEIIETIPGIQSHRGPHGITLLKHAQNRYAIKDISSTDKAAVGKVIEYLEGLGNANIGATSLPINEQEKNILPGNYKFGEGTTEFFTVRPSTSDPANYLSIIRNGLSPRLMHKRGDFTFSPPGASSVKIVFEVKDGQSISLTIYEPDPVVKAVKI